MSILIPPQMLNTMDLEDLWHDPVRRYMLPAFDDRRTDWPNHPRASRDSLHEADMWVVEGLTHRYPTKVLAEMLSTCPQYCGHCTRMDLVGNDVPQVEKHRFALPQPDALRADPRVPPPDARRARRGGLRRRRGQPAHPGAGDLRLAAAGHPQHPRHPAGHEGLHGPAAALPPGQGARGVRPAGEEGVRARACSSRSTPTSTTPGSSRRWCSKAADAAAGRSGFRDIRNQGVLLRGVNATAQGPARAVLHAPGPRAHPPVLLLHVRHDPQLRALADVGGGGAAAPARHHGLPAGLRDAAHRL